MDDYDSLEISMAGSIHQRRQIHRLPFWGECDLIGDAH